MQNQALSGIELKDLTFPNLLSEPVTGRLSGVLSSNSIVTWSREARASGEFAVSEDIRELQQEVQLLRTAINAISIANDKVNLQNEHILREVQKIAAREARHIIAKCLLVSCFVVSAALITVGVFFAPRSYLGFALVFGGAIVCYEVFISLMRTRQCTEPRH